MLGKIIFTLFAFFLLNVNGFSQAKNSTHYPKVKFSKVGDSKFDTLQFKATVKSIYQCPPCPEGAQCKPCIGDHVEVTDGNSDHSLRVFTYQLSLFKPGHEYRFLVRFRSKLHWADNIELIEIL